MAYSLKEAPSMAMIEFVRNYTDHSTDRGYQFQFRCDQCSNGYMSSYEANVIGTAGGLLQAAGSLFGGLLGSAGNSSFEIQRAIGGPAHDRALQKAVAEVKEKFRRCQRCGKWVCAEICWNERAAQCVGCTPKYEQEVISLRTQAQIQATNEQLQEKAHGVDYVSQIDMNPDARISLNSVPATPALPPQKSHFLPDSWQAQPQPPQSKSGVDRGLLTRHPLRIDLQLLRGGRWRRQILSRLRSPDRPDTQGVCSLRS